MKTYSSIVTYMEQHKSPYNEFLLDIVELHGKVYEDIFSGLFVNVFAPSLGLGSNHLRGTDSEGTDNIDTDHL